MVTNIAFYKFVELDGLPLLREEMRRLCREFELKGTVILSPEGINGFLASDSERIQKFWAALTARPEFADLTYKASESERIPFQRLLVKLKKEIIPFGFPEVHPARMTGNRISSEELKRWLDEKKDILLLDTRNDYEVSHGTFENAVDLDIQTFRQFPEKLLKASEKLRERPVVMFCTGGIRCEKATAYAVQHGFKNVYQLDGGILKYFELCGPAHYRGDCYVFDERKKLDPSLQEIQ